MSHEFYMSRCLELAKLGLGKVAPNPMVGAVIVHQDKIIGEGYHMQYGQAHAEVNAINSVKDSSLLNESTIYVSLEPCAHYGKTPPCSDLIIEKQIPEVVVACIDTYSEVAGKGIEKLKKAGRKVELGILEKEALELNRRFFTFHNKKRPYVILKWAQSLDGFIDIERTGIDTGVFWITQPETKQLVHKWRSEEAGILVGKNTVLNDDPELTVREVEGNSPTRFIVDPQNELDLSVYKAGNNKAKTIHINELVGNNSVKQILDIIYSENIQSVIIEGGSKTIQSFLDSGYWDEARILTGVTNIESGQKAPELAINPIQSYYFGKDKVEIFRNA